MEPFDLKKWPNFIAAGGSEDDAIVDQIQIDSRRIDSKNALFVALKGDTTDGHDFITHAAKLGAKYAIVRKGFMLPSNAYNIKLLEVEDPLKAFQEIAGSYRDQMNATVIAITGSYGKTMLKDLLIEIVKQKAKAIASPESFNSQIGVPLSLLQIRKEHEVAIIEAACSKPNEMEALEKIIKPKHVILTPVGKKHETTLGSHVWSEVEYLLKSKHLKGFRLIPKDPALDKSVFADSPFYWNQSHPSLPHAKTYDGDPGHFPFEIVFPNQEPYQGVQKSGVYYFIDLINMAVKSAHLLGVSRESIIEVIKDYEPEPWRTEIWKAPLGMTFINDTYCSDPLSVEQSMKLFEHSLPYSRKIVFFGGLKKPTSHINVDLKRVAQTFARRNINQIFLYGQKDYFPLIEELRMLSSEAEINIHPSYEVALDAYQKIAREGDFVLIKGEKKERLDKLTATFNDSICTNQCIINLAAIGSNIDAIRAKLPAKTRVMVMVKALAYGTDDVRIARFLKSCGVDIVGVSYVDEGVALKRAGLTQAIFTINAAIYEVPKVVKWGLEVGVSSHELIEELAIEAKLKNKIIKVHLHIDTGMSRFGCRPEEAVKLADQILEYPSLKLEGIMTHFACAENPDQDLFTLNQIKTFDAIVTEIESKGVSIPWKHAANSAGSIRFKLPQYNMVRVGLAVYGLYPSSAVYKELDLRLAVSLVSRIVGINVCKAGETISYGRSYIVQKEKQRIAVLPIGYFDGLHRNYSGKGQVMIRGKKAPMVGNICMDFMMVDLTDIPNAKVGDPVLIFGEDEYGHYLSPEDLALSGNSIVYELITCLGPRIQRIFVYEESQNVAKVR
jgi:alanine racemase/UDP-N-acetylmuramoyl-tripeptide--D-alanyl-D-alanine ligase